MNLTLVEEILLLLLDEEKGTLPTVPQLTLHIVVAGAVLMELAINNKIDNDLKELKVLDHTPLGEEIVDQFLRKMQQEPNKQEIKYWINLIADDGAKIVEQAFDRLVDRGILGETEKKFLWVMTTRTYPMLDGTVERACKLRIMNILYTDEIPDPKDVVIIALVDACDMFRILLGPTELANVRPRINAVSRLDLIGLATSKLIQDIQVALVATHAPLF